MVKIKKFVKAVGKSWRGDVRNRDTIGRSSWLLAHPATKGMPAIKLASQPAIDRSERLPIARRLLKAYALAKADEGSAALQLPQDDLWTKLLEAEFKELFLIIESGDAEALSRYLLHFGEEYAWFGGLTLSVDGFNEVGRDRASVALSYLDKLVCLAESLGVLELENPEQTSDWGSNLYLDANEILDRVEKAIGVSVATPAGAVPVTGIDTKGGLLHYRHFNSLYVAIRIKALLPHEAAICEYGGGLGMIAYYARHLGYRDYTIFDLPLTNLFAAHFLMNSLGAEAVRLYGEDRQSGIINILPYWECTRAPAAAYSMAINQDSFPEIDPALVVNYLKQIERTTSKYFLSINQEARASMGTRRQNSVPSLVRNFKNFYRMYRMRYWIREGYAEELYEIRH